MRLPFFLFLLCMSLGLAAQETDTMRINAAKREIRALFVKLGQATLQHDRATLEQIYSEEFIFIHGFGYVDDRQVQIRNVMETDSTRPPPLPDLNEFYLYGDIAVFRSKGPGVTGAGLINTTIAKRSKGAWTLVQTQSTLAQPTRTFVQLDPALLPSFTGRYGSNGQQLTLTLQHDTLVVRRPISPPSFFLPVSENSFFNKAGSELRFFRDGNGKIIRLIFRPMAGKETEWAKLD